VPDVADWFVVNVAEARALEHAKGGSYVRFEGLGERFPDFGINIHVLQPGQPNGRYHYENQQEDFLVLAGECIAIIDDEEHRLRAWDFVHCPEGTPHIFVGAGDGPCAILMVGARKPDEKLHYPVSEVAAKYGASVSEPTDDPSAAYADWGRDLKPTRLPWPL
jgi:uncharacterized cupin superfamily protein